VASYTVTRVRKETSSQGGQHEHIEGVCTTADVHYTRAEVVDSIRVGNTWRTFADGRYADIRPIAYCRWTGCLATPYITTEADETAKNNLENLPRC
jgi:hypothetical protein